MVEVLFRFYSYAVVGSTTFMSVMIYAEVCKQTPKMRGFWEHTFCFILSVTAAFCAGLIWPFLVAALIDEFRRKLKGATNGRDRKAAETGTRGSSSARALPFYPAFRTYPGAVITCDDAENRAGRHVRFVGASDYHITALVPDSLPEKLPVTTKWGEIVAYRYWRVEFRDGIPFLRSTYRDNIWMPGEPMKGEIYHELVAADGGGVHTFTDPGHAMLEAIAHERFTGMANEGGNWYRPSFVIGSVWIWGETIHHERGYRSEFAAIRSLDTLIGAERVSLVELNQRYGLSCAGPQ